MNPFLKKFIALILVAVFFTTNLFAFQGDISNLVSPKTAKAQVAAAVVESNPLTLANFFKTAIETTVSAVNTEAKNAFDIFVQNTFKILLETFKLRLLDMMTNQIVDWINGDEVSGPKFIQNWENFLGKQSTLARDILIDSIDKAYLGGQLCSPFALNIRNLLRRPGFNFGQQIIPSCTLDRVVANINSFYSNFSNGGWAAYSAVIQPQNNFYGNFIQILDSDELLRASKQRAAQNEGLAGQGFLPIKRCKIPDIDEVTGLETGACLEYETTSPGKVAGDAVSRAVGNRFDYIPNIQQFPAIAAVIVDAFVNKLIRSGVNGLLSYSSPNPPASGPGAGYVGQINQNCAALPAGPSKDACNAQAQASLPQATIAASQTVVNPGDTTELRWTGVNATTCVSPEFNTGNQTSGSIVVQLLLTKTFTINCSNASGSKSGSITISVKPTVSINAAPNPVISGEASTLNWSSSNATLCRASGAWTGERPISGSESTGALGASQTYSIQCSGPAGDSPVANITINVF